MTDDKVIPDPSPIDFPTADGRENHPVAEVETARAGATTAARVSVSDEEIGFCVDGVVINNLRVLITEEEPGIWVAQGLEIDYVAQGRSDAEVKQRFQDGLRATINEQLIHCRSIKQLLVPARQDVFLEFATAIEGPVIYSQVSIHVEPIKAALPITYLTETTKAA